MLNHIVIQGRLTRPPELRRTGSGIAVASFTLAVDRDFSPKDGGDQETDFIDCVAWRQTGEFVSKYFTKGRMAVVSGRLQIRSWTDKEGNKRRSAEVVADNVYFGDSRRDSDGGSSDSYGSYESAPVSAGFAGYTAPASNPASDFEMLEDDDDEKLPF
jgi:single-strand DNA-binding protein